MTSKKSEYDEESGPIGPRGAVSVSSIGKGRKYFEMGTSSNSRSFEVESWAFVSHENYSLQLRQRVEPSLDIDAIPATVHETLSFFRVYTSTVEKTQQLGFYYNDFNRILWNCVLNCILKSLAQNYIYLFLSSYVPHDIMFIPKMVPFMYGYNILAVISFLTNFTYALEPFSMILYYALVGVIHNAPWNRCDKRFFIEPNMGKNVTCIGTDEFRTVIAKFPKVRFFISYTITSNGSSIEVVPAPLKFYWETTLLLYKQYVLEMFAPLFVIRLFLMTIIVGLFCRQLYNKTIWQVLNYSHWTLNLFYVGTMLHIFIFCLETKMVTHKTMFSEVGKEMLNLMKVLDFDILSDLIGVPPVLHFIASRSNREINLAGDSATIAFSNTVNYMGRIIITCIMRKYCEHQYKAPLLFAPAQNTMFYLWPYYFSLVPFGGVLVCIFFFLHGVTEFLSFVIASNIALKSIQSAFPILKWWLILILILPYYFLTIWYCKVDDKNNIAMRLLIIHTFIKGTVALAEMLIIVFLYPAARLEDDITFHTGSPPPKIISLAIRILPIYFGVKYLWMMKAFYDFHASSEIESARQETIFIKKCFNIIIFVLAFGILYAVIKIVWIKKKNWRSLFRPVPQWGPIDHVQRQLRKQYDSREYISSTASRYLSRFLKSKLSARTYRLDVCYETDRPRRRSTVVQPPIDSFRFHDETKKYV